MRAGLGAARRALPPNDVWDRLAAAVRPAPEPRPAPRVPPYAVAALVVMLVCAAALGDLASSLGPSQPNSSQARIEEMSPAYGLPVDELVSQPEYGPRMMVPGMASGLWRSQTRLGLLRHAFSRSRPVRAAYASDLWLDDLSGPRTTTSAAPQISYAR